MAQLKLTLIPPEQTQSVQIAEMFWSLQLSSQTSNSKKMHMEDPQRLVNLCPRSPKEEEVFRTGAVEAEVLVIFRVRNSCQTK